MEKQHQKKNGTEAKTLAAVPPAQETEHDRFGNEIAPAVDGTIDPPVNASAIVHKSTEAPKLPTGAELERALQADRLARQKRATEKIKQILEEEKCALVPHYHARGSATEHFVEIIAQ